MVVVSGLGKGVMEWGGGFDERTERGGAVVVSGLLVAKVLLAYFQLKHPLTDYYLNTSNHPHLQHPRKKTSHSTNNIILPTNHSLSLAFLLRLIFESIFPYVIS